MWACPRMWNPWARFFCARIPPCAPSRSLRRLVPTLLRAPSCPARSSSHSTCRLCPLRFALPHALIAHLPTPPAGSFPSASRSLTPRSLIFPLRLPAHSLPLRAPSCPARQPSARLQANVLSNNLPSAALPHSPANHAAHSAQPATKAFVTDAEGLLDASRRPSYQSTDTTPNIFERVRFDFRTQSFPISNAFVLIFEHRRKQKRTQRPIGADAARHFSRSTAFQAKAFHPPYRLPASCPHR
jgi:hypothetical protein